MIDLHAHILPGIDDGPRDLEESLEMCRIAHADGISSMVATPHDGNGVYTNGREAILEAVRRLNEELRERAIPLDILPGADIRISPEVGQMLDSRTAMTVNDNGRYVMIELPDHTFPPRLAEWIFGIRLKGVTPILTHPERNVVLQRDFKPLYDWIGLGVLVQVTAMSLTGRFGRRVEEVSREMLSLGLVHVIASDAHSVKRRPPELSKARDVAAEMLGADAARQLVSVRPGLIVEGKPVEAPQPLAKRQTFLSRLFKRSAG